jgi:hypothetical protein
VTEEGDSEVDDLNITWGHNFANGRGNITLFDTWESEIVESGSPTIPAGVIFFPEVDFGNGPAPATFTSDGVPREFIDPDDRMFDIFGRSYRLTLSLQY